MPPRPSKVGPVPSKPSKSEPRDLTDFGLESWNVINFIMHISLDRTVVGPMAPVFRLCPPPRPPLLDPPWSVHTFWVKALEVKPGVKPTEIKHGLKQGGGGKPNWRSDLTRILQGSTQGSNLKPSPQDQVQGEPYIFWSPLNLVRNMLGRITLN